MNCRHELKFFVTDSDLELIGYRLKPLLCPDIHQNGNGYTVRSLYFDDFQDTCRKENEDGIGNREKTRIRIYNGDDTLIKLEKKIRQWDRIYKEVSVLSKAACMDYIGGRAGNPADCRSKQERELYTRIKLKGMHPVCIVEYERSAWVEPKGNVRITFDKNISGSSQVEHFLDKRIMSLPLLPKGISILEIKYDALLPQYLYEAINIGTLQRCSFSKYYYARAIAT